MYVDFNDMVCIRCLEDNESMLIKIVKSSPKLSDGEISVESPVGKKLIHRKKDDEFVVALENGEFITYRVENIEKNIKNLDDKIDIIKDDLKLQLLTKLKEYGFQGFIHTTELNNFKSIVTMGALIPRNVLKFDKIEFIDKANQDIINRTDEFVKNCCRFYYAFDTPTNYAANYAEMISIVFDESIIYSKKTFFSPHNAYFGFWTNDITSALKYDWEGIFERGPYTLSKYFNRDCSEDYESLKRRVNAIRNAELLYCGNISISYIKKIVVYNEKVYNELRIFCDSTLFDKVVLEKEKRNVEIF